MVGWLVGLWCLMGGISVAFRLDNSMFKMLYNFSSWNISENFTWINKIANTIKPAGSLQCPLYTGLTE
jgi:hypothetical protein